MARMGADRCDHRRGGVVACRRQAPCGVQWSARPDENGWEAYKAARHQRMPRAVWTPTVRSSPGDARTFGLFRLFAARISRAQNMAASRAGLVTAQLAGWEKPGLEEGFSGAAGNFEPVYEDLPNKRVVFTYLGPTLASQGSVEDSCRLDARAWARRTIFFVAECFMDELAVAGRHGLHRVSAENIRPVRAVSPC